MNRLTIDKLYSEIFILMTHCATADLEYIASNECAKRFKNILEGIKQYKDIEDELGCSLQLYYIMCIKGTELYAMSIFSEIKEPIKQWFNKYTYNKEKQSFGKAMEGYGWIEFYKLSDYGKTWALTKEELL